MPRVSPDVLARALGHSTGLVLVFAPDEPAVPAAEEQFATLERRSLAQARSRAGERSSISASPLSPETEVVNDAVGRFAL